MHALQGITIADPNLPDCPLMYVNEAFCRMTGYDQDEILGRNCRFLQGPETDKAALARIKIAMQQVRYTEYMPRHAVCILMWLNSLLSALPFLHAILAFACRFGECVKSFEQQVWKSGK